MVDQIDATTQAAIATSTRLPPASWGQDGQNLGRRSALGRRLSWRAQMTGAAIALTTLPILLIGAMATHMTYQLGQKVGPVGSIAGVALDDFPLLLGWITLSTALIAGAGAIWWTQRLIKPLREINAVMGALVQGQRDRRLAVPFALTSLGANVNRLATQLQTLSQQETEQAQRAQHLTKILVNLRAGRNAEAVFQTVVSDLRMALPVDRVMIYSCQSGQVLAESVGSAYPSARPVAMTGLGIALDGASPPLDQVLAIANIETATLTPQARHHLTQLRVKASISVPIVVNGQLRGWLIGHRCTAPRSWQPAELGLIQQVVGQLGWVLEHLQQHQEQTAATTLMATWQQQLNQWLQALEAVVNGHARSMAPDLEPVSAGEIGAMTGRFKALLNQLQAKISQVQPAIAAALTTLSSAEQTLHQLTATSRAQAETMTQILATIAAFPVALQTWAETVQQVHHDGRATGAATGLAELEQVIIATTEQNQRLGQLSQHLMQKLSDLKQMALHTHLLAINAHITAAHTGEVSLANFASEVAELTARSTTHLHQIEQILLTLQSETAPHAQTALIADQAMQAVQTSLALSASPAQLQALATAIATQQQTYQTLMPLMKTLTDPADCPSLPPTTAVVQMLQAATWQ